MKSQTDLQCSPITADLNQFTNRKFHQQLDPASTSHQSRMPTLCVRNIYFVTTNSSIRVCSQARALSSDKSRPSTC